MRKQVDIVASGSKSRRGRLLCVESLWTVGMAGWEWDGPMQAGALNLSTAEGARVGRDENLALVAFGAFVHGRHALGRLVKVDDEPPARWLGEAHRNGGVCRGGGEAVEVDAPPDERLVRCLLLLAKVAQASIQPFWARPTAAAAAPPLVEECLG